MLFRDFLSSSWPKSIKRWLFSVVSHACLAFLLCLDCDILVMWTSVWLCICTCLVLVKKINSFFYLKLGDLYSWCVEGYQLSPNNSHRGTLPWKWNLNDLPLICLVLELSDYLLCSCFYLLKTEMKYFRSKITK